MLVMFLSQCCWFEDPMIGDSEIMGNVQKKGITFDGFVELARKHVDIEAFKAQHSSLEQFTNCVIQTISTGELYMILSYSRKTVNQTGDGHFSPMAAYHKGRDMLLILDVARYKYPFHWLPRMTVWDAMNKIDKETDETRGKHVDIEAFKAQHSSLEQFTNCVIQTTSTEELYMILSYFRKTVNQTGDGHFSPMAAYHKRRDMLLILDVARYKYPFHWLPRMTVWDAMNKIDKETDETRGKHVDIEAFKTQHSSLEQFTNCVIQTTSTEELYMILSYSRKTINQTGDGHFSPMAAYHKGRNMLLILDVARYKYPFHWLPRMTVWDAMNKIDKETGRDMLLILDVARYKYPFHWLPRMTVWDAMNEIDKETDETRGFMMVRKKIS
ncbi:uncharacterized protein LOC114272163 isoform X1 [Camellia sinensis]|uniref:uncharacterized protein LOC114272163 isoform X1 n=2 Tax=Camellia sinensis TaxID=4442 RepID=UPI001035FBF0|nr:uncharacterized protein LOC114272163 isoform X1 [Camellia sinensis]